MYLMLPLLLAGLTAQGLEPLSRARLLADRSAVTPGGQETLGLQLVMAPGWHTYADPPGDSGMAPRINFKQPSDLRDASWRFPPPHAFRDAAGVTYGYENVALLLIDARVPPDAPVGGNWTVRADVEWLICRELCRPMFATVELELPVRDREVLFPNWTPLLRRGGWPAARE
ncbi:MAG: hypothetical protein LC725_07180 [Lentisphaerae bacterium]|nr:hypothetical protein [Lentisphaerota bacterium]